jgi:hypothetical protein
MTSATEFLLGAPDGWGVTVRTIVDADDGWLEDRHDWVQWAFPNREPSAFNDEAPVWTVDEARSLPPLAVANLKLLLARYERFLSRTSWWRCRFDHNHARITRVLLCLRDAGLREEAQAFHRVVDAAPEPGVISRLYWADALREEREEPTGG